MQDFGSQRLLVLDTNVVLDLLLFFDVGVQEIRSGLATGQLAWISTAGMRDEFIRVLDYPPVARQMVARVRAAETLVADFDRQSRPMPAAPPASVRCRDRDDQMFVDLAVMHRATLWSKDLQVLRLRRRLADLGVDVVRPLRLPAC